MAKKNIKTVLKTKDEEHTLECLAIVSSTQIQYLDQNFVMVIDKRDDCVTMVRKNVDYEIFFHFEDGNTYGYFIINQQKLPFDLVLQTLEVLEHKIHIVYLFSEDEYDYVIEY